MAAIDAVVEASYINHTASAAKRGRNPKLPYVPVIKIKTDMYSGVRTENPTRNRAYATRDEAVAVAQKCIDSYRAKMRNDLTLPHHMAEREWRGLPRDIMPILAAAGRFDRIPAGTRVSVTFGKYSGQQGIVRQHAAMGAHFIELDGGDFADVNRVQLTIVKEFDAAVAAGTVVI